MSKYTYTGKYAAKLGSQLVTIPDKVFHNQRSFHNAAKSFIALRANGRRVRVLLDGDAYGLNSSGTGDPVVRRFRMEDRSIMNDVCEFTTHSPPEVPLTDDERALLALSAEVQALASQVNALREQRDAAMRLAFPGVPNGEAYATLDAGISRDKRVRGSSHV